jgi:hypothetical protein
MQEGPVSHEERVRKTAEDDGNAASAGRGDAEGLDITESAGEPFFWSHRKVGRQDRRKEI